MENQKMNADFFEAIEDIEKEKGIPRGYMYDKIKQAMLAAFRKDNPDCEDNVAIDLDEEKYRIEMYVTKTVVDAVEDPSHEINLEAAKKISRRVKLGETVNIPVETKKFGRIAAQQAKQIITQGIREAERGKIYDEYVEKENEILTAIVQRVESKCVYVELGLTEGVMEESEYMPGEEYREGDHIKVYVLQVHRNRNDAQRVPQVYVSRIHPGLVKRLFEMEVPEIANGIVQIKSIAREAGSRTKMAVYSSDVQIDPVGACVGPRGSRVEKVIAELRNEKIDIIKWSPDPAEFVANALNPAHVVSVFISDAEKICRVIVPDNQLSLAIGKEGQNARLAAKLTGWKIDIKSETQFEEHLREQGLSSAEEAMGGYPEQDYYDQDPGYEE